MRRILFWVLVCLSAVSGADGTYFGPTELPPEIPSQRAFLRQKDGEVTMIVESVLNAKVGDYGWVVPVPAVPSYVNSVKVDYMRQAFETHRPKVRRESAPDLPSLIFLLFSAGVFVTSGWRYRKMSAASRGPRILAEVLLLFLIHGIFFAVFAQAKFAAKKGSSSRPTIEVLGQYGSYNVVLLDPDAAPGGEDAIENWLKENKFVVSDAKRQVIRDYAAKHWKFVVAKFRHDLDGNLPPHPLKIVYPGNKLVYPMRLTGQTDQPLFLEMLVVGKQSVSVPGLKVFTANNQRWKVDVLDEVGYRNDQFKDWKYISIKGAEYGDVTTYLRGELSPAQMQEDLVVSPAPYEPVNEFLTRDSEVPGLVLSEVAWAAVAVGMIFALIGIWLPTLTWLGLVATVVICGARAKVYRDTLNVVDSGHLVTEDRYLNRELRAIQYSKTMERMGKAAGATKKR
jgi:hypothetical protein